MPGDLVRVGGALVGADQMQAQVDARGRARTRGDVAQVDVEHVRLDLDPGMPRGEFVGHAPVSGRPATLQQSGLGEQEGGGAQRDDTGAAAMRPP